MASAKEAPPPPKARTDSGQVLSAASLSALIGYASAKLVSTVATTVLVVFAAELAFLKWLELHGVITVNWCALGCYTGPLGTLTLWPGTPSTRS